MTVAKRKYDYYHVATSYVAENFFNYNDALKFYGQNEKPSTLWGVVQESNDYVCIKAK